MSQQIDATRIPTLTLGWRLKMALGEMHAQEMADLLGVNRGTVSRWMADKGAPPKRAYLLQWAMATDTDYGWLETGNAPGSIGPEGEGLPRLDSNQQPFGLPSSAAAIPLKRFAAEILGDEAA